MWSNSEQPAQNPLLLLPALGDNVAMQAEPPDAEPPKRKRRWFQFSLRTLMIVVTLLAVPCAYVGWQATIVRERNAELDREINGPRLIGLNLANSTGAIPWVRWVLGDACVDFIKMPTGTQSEELDRIRALFPEAVVEVSHDLSLRP